jgi:hypothetical protein
MSRNGSGTYNLPAGNPVVTGTTITSTWANSTLSDIASALTGSVAADGQTPMTGALNMTNHQINNVTDPSSAQDAATKAYVDGITGGYGTMASQNASSVAITGGSITGTSITGNISGSATKLATASFSVEESGGKLLFKYGTTTIASLDSSGNFTTLANVNAAGTP